jgi:uncharacterized alkaline shock family protein YloU
VFLERPVAEPLEVFARVPQRAVGCVRARARVRIQLGLVLRFGWAADRVAAQARAGVIDAVEMLTGLWAERVDIVVADVAEGD